MAIDVIPLRYIFFAIFLILATIFVIGIAYGIRVYNQTKIWLATFVGIWVNDDGTIKDIRPIKPTSFLDFFNPEYQLKGSTPNKVKFKVPAKGMAKAEDMEEDIANIKEFKKGRGKLIIIGKRGLNAQHMEEKRIMTNIINSLSSDANQLKNKNDELESKIEKIVDQKAEQSHKWSPKFYKPPSSKQSTQQQSYN